MGIAQNSAAEFELSEEQVYTLIKSARSFRNRVILEILYSSFGGASCLLTFLDAEACLPLDALEQQVRPFIPSRKRA